MNSGCILNPEWHCNEDASKHFQCKLGPLDTSLLCVLRKKTFVVNKLSRSLTFPPGYLLSFSFFLSFFLQPHYKKKCNLSPQSNEQQECSWVSNFLLHSYVNQHINCVKPSQLVDPEWLTGHFYFLSKGNRHDLKHSCEVQGEWEGLVGRSLGVAHIQHLIQLNAITN